jgi:hypothetical protein
MKAADGVALMVQKIVPVVLEKASITSATLSADGEIRDPVYTVEGYWVTGLQAKVGVRGVTVRGSVVGQGSGPDKPLTPETIAWLRENDPTLLEWLLREAAKHLPTTTEGP